MDSSKQSILDTDSQYTLHKAIISKYQDLEKYRRFKVGCGVSDCDISDLIYLSDMVCNGSCHITKKQKNKIKEKIQRYVQ